MDALRNRTVPGTARNLSFNFKSLLIVIAIALAAMVIDFVVLIYSSLLDA